MSARGLIIAILALVLIGGGAIFVVSTPKPQPAAMSAAPEQTEQDLMAEAEENAGTETTTPVEQETTPAAAADNLLAAPASLAVDVPKAMTDRVLGSDTAPVTIIEYASLTCPHCAHFHNSVLADVKKRLVETGKVRLIFRDFPLDTFALRASMMLRCAPADKYFNLLEVVFRNQERWTKSNDPLQALAQLGALSGMDEEFIGACMKNAELEAALLRGMQDAQRKYKIQSTPTFVVNEGAEQFTGGANLEQFTAAVSKVSAGK